MLKGANQITALSYLYGDTGNSALQSVQVSGSSAVMKSTQITGFFLSKRRYSFVRNNRAIIFPSPQ